MKKPEFYCQSFIENHNNLPKFQPADCKEQCSKCMDVIIDHHFNKKEKAEKSDQNKESTNTNNSPFIDGVVYTGKKVNRVEFDSSIPPCGDYRWILVGDEWVLLEERQCESCKRVKPLRFFQYISKVCYSCQKRTKIKNQA